MFDFKISKLPWEVKQCKEIHSIALEDLRLIVGVVNLRSWRNTFHAALGKEN